MLIVMAGLPATGKSTIAGQLAAALDAVVLSKDVVRAAVFPPQVLDYSSAQDDLCMEMVYQAVGYIADKDPGANVILDGRTYSKQRQVARLLEAVGTFGLVPQFIECVCDDAIAAERLETSNRTPAHPALNRDLALYRRLRADAEPFTVPRVVVDTGALGLEESVALCLEYLPLQ